MSNADYNSGVIGHARTLVQAEIEQLHDEKDRMAEELRKLRLACTNATQQEEELLRMKRDLGEARGFWLEHIQRRPLLRRPTDQRGVTAMRRDFSADLLSDLSCRIRRLQPDQPTAPVKERLGAQLGLQRSGDASGG